MTEGSHNPFHWWNGWVLGASSCRGLWRKGRFSHASNTDNNTSPNTENNTSPNSVAGCTSGPLLFDDVSTPFANCIWLFQDITEFPKAQLLPLGLQSMRSEFVFGNAVFNFHLKITLTAISGSSTCYSVLTQNICRVQYKRCLQHLPRQFWKHGSNLREIELQKLLPLFIFDISLRFGVIGF